MHVDSCYDFIYLLYGFRKINTNRLYTHNSYNMLKKKIYIAYIFITLTKIHNEIHYFANKKEKNPDNCSDGIGTLSVNMQGSRRSDYKITAMVQ